MIQTTDTGEWQTPSWLPDGDGGLPIPRDVTPDDSTARVMADCALRLPLDFSSAEAEEELWQATPLAWESSLIIYRLPLWSSMSAAVDDWLGKTSATPATPDWM